MAYDLFGNPVRKRLYLFIKENPGLVFGDIYAHMRPVVEEMTGKNYPASSLARTLTQMRTNDVLTTNLRPDQLAGRSPQYFANDKLVEEMLDAFLEDVSEMKKRS